MGTTDPAAIEYDAVIDDTSTETVHDAEKPVDVTVVGSVVVNERPSRSITTDQVAVQVFPAPPVRVAGAVPTRERLRLRLRAANGLDVVYIGTDQVTPGTGYVLAGGESIDLNARCAVYAIADPANSGDPTIVHVLSEHHDG